VITFKKIKYKNFLSTGQQFTEIELNSCRNTILIGSNGAGKSTILDALTFALFNKPFRKINKPQLVNSVNNKECLVEVEFKIGSTDWLVRRGMKPNIFEIYKDGTMLGQNADAKEDQDYLEQKILKLNFKSFTQIVVLGSSTFVPFMQLPAAQRREIIEDLLDIKIFSSMNVILKERVKSLLDEIKDISRDVDILENKIEVQQKYIESLKQQNNNQIESKENKLQEFYSEIEDNTKQLDLLYKQIDTLQQEYNSFGDLNHKIKQLEKYKNKFSITKDSAVENKKFYEHNDSCPTCNQSLTSQIKLENISQSESQIKKMKSAISEVDEEINKIQEILEKKSNVLEQINFLNTKTNTFTHSNNHITKIIKDINQEILDIKNNSGNIENELSNLNTLIDQKNNNQTKLNEYQKQKINYSIISNLLKDTGIKTKIIKRYLPVMNKTINDYLQSMDFYVNFTLNESFEETIKSRFRDEFSYSSFSEGEKARIDIALMLTWRTIAKLKNSMDTNLLILDEIFDSSLDSSATDELSYILRTFTDNLNLFIISHREHMTDKFHRVLKFKKIKNFSKMEEVKNAVEV
jgi:DNA repair exonuclease SbcCD ATPase subunit